MSNKQKRKELLARREARSRYKNHESLTRGLQEGTVVRVDQSKIFSRSVLQDIPEYYYDIDFECRDCGVIERWTAKKQKIYYEEQQGEIEGLPIRCNSCRRKNREEKAEVRRIHLAGIQKKTTKTGEQAGDCDAEESV
jgi:hypothetical protein